MVTLITGGVRSGKSGYALTLAAKHSGSRVFIATGAVCDDEMRVRIENHRKERDSQFQTIEEQVDLVRVLDNIEKSTSVVVIDCLTTWLGNLFHYMDGNEKSIMQRVEHFAEHIPTVHCDLIMITNEVGWGIVPDNSYSRLYRDIAGFMNSSVARKASFVYLCVCGIPLTIKGMQDEKI